MAKDGVRAYPAEPRPPWWRREARKRWDTKAEHLTKIANAYLAALDVEARVIDAMIVGRWDIVWPEIERRPRRDLPLT